MLKLRPFHPLKKTRNKVITVYVCATGGGGKGAWFGRNILTYKGKVAKYLAST